jgi:hypothetical protein
MARARGGAAWWVLAAAWVLWAAAAAAEAEARSPSARRVHRHLKRLNKPAVKSIEVLVAPSSVEFEMIALSSACSVELCLCHEGWEGGGGGVQIQVSFQLDALGGDLFLGLLDLFPIFWFHTSVRFSGSKAVPPHYSTTKKATFVRFFWAFLAGSFSLSLWRIISKVLAFWR